MTYVVVRVQFYVLRKSLKFLLDKFKGFKPSKSEFSLGKSCLVELYFFTWRTMSDEDKARVGKIEEVVADSLRELIS